MGNTNMEVLVKRASPGSDIHGLVKGIAEEYAHYNHTGAWSGYFDLENWLNANGILTNYLFDYFKSVETEKEDVEEFIHESIRYRTEDISQQHPENDMITNWLIAQKEYAVFIYKEVTDIIRKKK